MRRRTLILGGAGLLAAFGFMLTLGAWQSGDLPWQEKKAASAARIRAADPSAMTWQLTSHEGEQVEPQDWLGQANLVFFGFTWCPDVCPMTLLNISDWLEELGPDADRLAGHLVTVDPERDNPEVLADYLSNFDPRITGLTGTPAEIARAAEAFGATYRRVLRQDGDYTMDHTSGVLVFRADGRLARIIDLHENPQAAVPKIRQALKQEG
ncbi:MULTISPECIES: SCO family protein [unclassified Paracoccus (in: a-proteobacteria)]|uniref:SCO family protein n=1 Tax=Paracoccus TaxID=265 RepID=UPI000CD2AAA4|nr:MULTISPECIES: SCO family protein [unclassified Paracoccus (in: a-proteobacteria)]MDQ1901946.1 SCO family protein [Paracoccus sp. WLY502]